MLTTSSVHSFQRAFALLVLLVTAFVPLGCGNTPDTLELHGTYGGSTPVSVPPGPIADAGTDGSNQQPLPPPAPPPDGGVAPPPPPPTAFTSASTCGHCHATIYAQWQTSMHSRALVSPVTIAQANQVARGPVATAPSPDPQRICLNCHSPNAALVTTGDTLPLPAASLADEGVSCESCHQFAGQPAAGGAGYSFGFQHGLAPGKTMLGPLDGPVANAFHQSASADAFTRPNTMCANCHDVNYDNNHDGVIVKGVDLVLQQTWDEYVLTYKLLGGTETCVSCHMPVAQGLTRVADGASIPGQQSTPAPPRVVHDHSFVGVDYALDNPTQAQASAPARQALLQGAASLFVDSVGAGSGGVGFRVTVANTGTGHNLPSGFAFTRQMWLEVTVTDDAGQVVGSSGLLANPTDNLCDANTIFEFNKFGNPLEANPLGRFLQGCDAGVDQQLVSLQQKLVNQVNIALENGLQIDQLGQPIIEETFFGGHEAALQWLQGGVVPRTRPFDGRQLGALQPFQFQSFDYDIGTSGSPATLTVRLLFRNMPPYFLRALATSQPATETPQLAPLIANVEAIEMARVTVPLL